MSNKTAKVIPEKLNEPNNYGHTQWFIKNLYWA
jgi:hypothetical protein